MTRRIQNQLAAERHARGWTQSQLAELGGISRQSYSAIEAGEAVPSTEIALRLARGLGRRVEELFRLPEEEGEARRAVWVGEGNPIGRRARLARVAGRLVALDASAGERPSRPADGVVVEVAGSGAGAWGEGERGSDRGENGEVDVVLFEDRPAEPALVVAGCDPAFGLVAEALRRERSYEVAWLPLGSRAALEALARGEAHVAGAHLRDHRGDGFNAGWVREIVPFECTRVTFAVWEQGLLVEAGNPKRIEEIADLARADLRYLNREPGSGSRALLDDHLSKGGIEPGLIRGYETRAKGHLAVAEAIAAGLADAGIAIRAAGQALGLHVVTLAEEPYELVIPNHFLDLPAVGALIDTLRRPGLKAQVEALGGYDVAAMGRPS